MRPEILDVMPSGTQSLAPLGPESCVSLLVFWDTVSLAITAIPSALVVEPVRREAGCAGHCRFAFSLKSSRIKFVGKR